jgi:hypothetical protein
MQVQLTNVGKPEQAANVIKALEGKSYMAFHVAVCPVGGSFDVVAETTYDAPEDEVRGMLFGLLCDALGR